MEFIEFRLLWEGRVNRSDIAEKFEVSVQQASADLGLYERAAPANLAYDRTAKTFVPAPAFAPVYLREHADRQLLQLAAIENGWIDKEDTWFDALPPVGVVPVPPRRVPNATMHWILSAIRDSLEIRIDYQSMSRRDPTRRWIAPHALGYDGARWHARAWCPTHREFRDFVLSRVLAVHEKRPAPSRPETDRAWHTMVELILTPNPELSDSAQKAVAREYQMRRGQLRVPLRAAMVFYFIQHFNLDAPALPLERRQIVLANRAEVEAAVENAAPAESGGG